MTQATAAHLFLGLLWAQLGLALAPSWLDGTYYSYGWVVLFACVAFYWMRRQDLLLPSVPLRRGWAAKVSLLLLLVIVVLAVEGIRLVQGANPFWRLLLWTQALLTLLATVALLAYTDGVRAARHYLPALVLILVAVPLPSSTEVGLVQNLTRSVVVVSSDLARSSGIPLEVSDTAFIVRGQPLDVNDRCSGIRSFQSSLAVALMVGELLRLIFPARIILLLVGAGASFGGNSFRVLTLVQAFFEGGYEQLEARHDSAGLISVSLTYGLILGTGFLLDRWFAPGSSGRSGAHRSGSAAKLPSGEVS